MPDELSLSLRARVALETHGFHFTHSLGQNFLLNDHAVAEIVARAGVKEGDYILEIGPGAGLLTASMVDAGADVLAVELDRAVEPVLRNVLGERRARVVFADCMKADLKALTAEAFGENAPFSIVANLPYYITADFLMRAVRLSPERITVMVQREAAERMLSQPGDKNWCATAATVRYFAEPSMVMEAPASLFTPPPHVDSALLKLEMRKTRAMPAEQEEAFLNLIQVAFRMRRKTLVNNLTTGLSLSRTDALRALENAGLDGRVRGETLTLADFKRLAEALNEKYSN